MENQNTLLKDRYSVIRLLGRGGMGEVFLAEDKLLSRQVAVKKVIYSDHDFLLKSAEKEAMVLARLQHHCLPKVLDYFNEDNAQYIVMEYIAGKDLGELLRNNHAPFSSEQIWPWLDTLLDILEYLHNQSPPVVHRDIKPQNIKITDSGKLFLLDFGLVKDTPTRVRSDSMSLSVYGYSQSYAPLEQINGDPTSVQTDVYELCATLYHLLTNVKPADALDRATKKIEHKSDSLRPAHEVNPSVPVALSQVLEAGLQLSCDERIKSIKALRERLHQVKNRHERIHINFDSADNGNANANVPVPAKTNFLGGKRKLYGVIAVAAIAVLALASFIGYRMIKGREAERQFNEAQASERAEGLLSQNACAKYKEIEADYLSTGAARELVRKLNDCYSAPSLLQQASEKEKLNGLNQETTEAYRKIMEGYPGSVSALQAEKRVNEFEKNKQATINAWNAKQKIDISQITANSSSQYFSEVINRYSDIDINNSAVDKVLIDHIKSLIGIVKDAKNLFLEIEQEANRWTELKRKEVQEFCERSLMITRVCIEQWWAENREAQQQSAWAKAAEKYKDRLDKLIERSNNITAESKDIKSKLEAKYKAEFIDRAN